MSCSDGWDNSGSVQDIILCPVCGEEVDESGEALTGCFWSPVSCETCGCAPCDESC